MAEATSHPLNPPPTSGGHHPNCSLRCVVSTCAACRILRPVTTYVQPKSMICNSRRPLSVTPPISAALRKSAHVALCAAFREFQLRATVRTRLHEAVAVAVGIEAHLHLSLRSSNVRRSLDRFRRRARRLRSSVRCGEQLLLNTLLLARPFLERDSDRVRNGQHLVRSESNCAIRADAAQLLVHFTQRNS